MFVGQCRFIERRSTEGLVPSFCFIGSALWLGLSPWSKGPRDLVRSERGVRNSPRNLIFQYLSLRRKVGRRERRYTVCRNEPNVINCDDQNKENDEGPSIA